MGVNLLSLKKIHFSSASAFSYRSDLGLVCMSRLSSYPASLLLCAVGVAVQAGESGSRWHRLARLVPAASVAESSGITLTLLVQDGVQSERQRDALHGFL